MAHVHSLPPYLTPSNAWLAGDTYLREWADRSGVESARVMAEVRAKRVTDALRSSLSEHEVGWNWRCQVCQLAWPCARRLELQELLDQMAPAPARYGPTAENSENTRCGTAPHEAGAAVNHETAAART